jgi:hypothetical protein
MAEREIVKARRNLFRFRRLTVTHPGWVCRSKTGPLEGGEAAFCRGSRRRPERNAGVLGTDVEIGGVSPVLEP